MLKSEKIISEIVSSSKDKTWAGFLGDYWSEVLKKKVKVNDPEHETADETDIQHYDFKRRRPIGKKKKIEDFEELSAWFGPEGKIWCEEKNKFVEPDTKGCLESTTLKSQDEKRFRYLKLHDDYKSY